MPCLSKSGRSWLVESMCTFFLPRINAVCVTGELLFERQGGVSLSSELS